MYPIDTGHKEASDPLAIILSGRQRQRKFCDDLETIADQLLDRVDPKFCELLLNHLSGTLPLLQSDEEALYSVMRAREAENRSLTNWIDQAITEHRGQEDYVLELTDPLTLLSAGQSVENVQATGYLLRCAFESIRHHLAWEDITLFGGFFELITTAEAPVLLANLAQNRRAQASGLRLIN